MRGFFARLNTLAFILSLFAFLIFVVSGLSLVNEQLVRPDYLADRSDGVSFVILGCLLPPFYIGTVMTFSWLLGQGFKFPLAFKLFLSKSQKTALVFAGAAVLLSLIGNLSRTPTGDAALRAGYNPTASAIGQCVGMLMLGGLVYAVAFFIAEKSKRPGAEVDASKDRREIPAKTEAKIPDEKQHPQPPKKAG